MEVDIAKLLSSSDEDEVKKGLSLLQEIMGNSEEGIDDIEEEFEEDDDECEMLFNTEGYQDELDLYQSDLLSIVKNDLLSNDTRKLALDIVTDIDPGDSYLHGELVEIIYMFDDEIALKAAEVFELCYNISDVELLEDMQRIVLNHSSRKVRLAMKTSLEGLVDCHGVSEEIDTVIDNGLLNTQNYSGGPEDFGDALMIREIERQKNKKYDIFISFASEDRENIVKPLIEELTSHGLKVWFDQEKIETGDFIRDKIFDGLDRAQCTLAIISPNYLKKPWTSLEFEEIISLWKTCNIPFIPLLRGTTIKKMIKINKAFTYLKCGVIDESTITENARAISSYFKKLVAGVS